MNITPPIHSEFSCDLIRNKIIDTIILATVPLGIVATFLELYRDYLFGFVYAVEFAIFNIVSVLIALLIFLFRKIISLDIKIYVISALFFFTGLRGLMEFGSLSNTYILIAISLIILQLRVSRTWMLIIILLTPVIIFMIGIITQYSPLITDLDYNELMRSGKQWGADIAIFMFLVAVVLLGIGRYQQELRSSFRELEKVNRELDAKNLQLQEEMEKREKYESEMEISSRKFKLLFDSSIDGVVLINEDFYIIEANPVVFDATGYKKDELYKISIFDLVDKQHKAETINRFYRLLNGEPQPLSQINIITKQGKKKSVELNSNLIIGSEGELSIFSTIRDVSFRKSIEDQKFNAVLEAEENERERFSRNLHDELGPLFSTVKLYVESLKTKETDAGKSKILDKLSDIVNEGVRNIREVSHSLSPHLLRDKGLEKSIEVHLKRIKESARIDTEFECKLESAPEKLNDNINILIYRVFLELLNNAIKHSKASKIIVNMTMTSDTLYFKFCDNGIGFKADEISQSESGIGLKNIMNRIHARNGEVVFSFDKLMKVEIQLPL